MAITRGSVGAFHNVFNAANQPSPGAFSPGDYLLLLTGEFIGADTVTTPAGWTRLDPNSAAHQVACFGLKSVTGTEAMPSFTWGGQFSWTIVLVYHGLNSLTVLDSGDRFASSTGNIVGPAGSVVPPLDGCLVLFAGSKNKTSTSDGTTFTAPAGFSMVVQEAPNGSRSAVGICDWIQTTATTIAGNQVMSGSIVDGVTQSEQGFIIVLGPPPAPPAAATVGFIPRPGSPALSSPSNLGQFKRVVGISQAPSISAPIAGQFSSNSTFYGPIARFAPLSVGFVPQPGPGIGPFSNNQFETFTWATTNPSPTTAPISGLLVSSSTVYGGFGTSAGQLNGILPSSSTFYGALDGLLAGSMSGIWASSSVAYTGIGGVLDMSFALCQSNSTLTMLQIGGSFQPLVPFTAVVDVRLNIGYQPWKIVPEGTIG